MLENEKNKFFLTIETAVVYKFLNLKKHLNWCFNLKKNCNLYELLYLDTYTYISIFINSLISLIFL